MKQVSVLSSLLRRWRLPLLGVAACLLCTVSFASIATLTTTLPGCREDGNCATPMTCVQVSTAGSITECVGTTITYAANLYHKRVPATKIVCDGTKPCQNNAYGTCYNYSIWADAGCVTMQISQTQCTKQIFCNPLPEDPK